MIARRNSLSRRIIVIGVVIMAAVLAYLAVSTELWRYGFSTSERFRRAPWLTRASDHFVFHYFAKTAADYHLDSIIAGEEAAYARVSATLGTEPSQPIDCYLYPSVSELYRWTRMSRPFAEGTIIHLIYESYGTVDSHEVTHVIARGIGRPSRFLQEGLAVSMEQDVGGEPLSDRIAAMAGWNVDDDFLAAEYERFDQRLDARGYAVAGAFVTYLRETYGNEKMLRL